MARKNMGKVKRYRRSFYSGGQQVRRILAGVLALAAHRPGGHRLRHQHLVQPEAGRR